jgi:hypothetical protein
MPQESQPPKRSAQIIDELRLQEMGDRGRQVDKELKRLREEAASLSRERESLQNERKGIEELLKKHPEQHRTHHDVKLGDAEIRIGEIDFRQREIAQKTANLEAVKGGLEQQYKAQSQKMNFRAESERKVTLPNGAERTVKRPTVPGESRRPQETSPLKQGQQAKIATPKPADVVPKSKPESPTKQPTAKPPVPAPIPAAKKPKGPKL